MGSTPSYTIKADLNGTGTLVDITSYVDAEQGLTASTGRSEWTAADPQAGMLSFALRNDDGRFTPGNTAVYTVGCVTGMLVEWACGARVRRYRAGVPELTFPEGVSGLSVVTVQCQDALAQLAARKMLSMLGEQVASLHPVAYYPLSESGTGLAPRCVDESGNAQVSLIPTGSTTGVEFGWANGKGPSTDGRGALMLRGDATTPPTDSADLFTGQTVDGFPLQIVPPGWDGANPPPASSDADLYYLDASSTFHLFAVSMWFNARDVYGGTSTTADPLDGPYVELWSLRGTGTMVLTLRLRIPDRKLVLCVNGEGMRELSTDDYSLDMGATHHVAVAFKAVKYGHAFGHVIRATGYVDGVQLTSCTGAGTYYGERPAWLTVGGIHGSVDGTGTDPSTYGLSGTVAHLSLHGPPEVQVNTVSNLTPALFPGVEEMYGLGMVGPLETPEARVTRLVGWLGDTAVTHAPQGTSNGMLVGPQDTTGKTMLSAVCDALRTEDAQVDTVTTAGVAQVRSWLDSYRHDSTVDITIDVDQDGQNVPVLSYDSSGVAVDVTATGGNKDVRAVWHDTAADARWAGTSDDVTSALVSESDLLLLAQYRAMRGRTVSITPTQVTVDARNSKTDLTATLLGLRPGARVRVTGLPSSVLGYATTDCFLSGMSERHGVDGAVFTLRLVPLGDLPDDHFDTVERFGVEQVSIGAPAVAPFVDSVGFNTTATSFVWVSNPDFGGQGLSTDAADYPLWVKVQNEVIKLPNAASAGVARGGWPAGWVDQTVSGVLRGQLGTTAAVHSIYDVLQLWDSAANAAYGDARFTF